MTKSIVERINDKNKMLETRELTILYGVEGSGKTKTLCEIGSSIPNQHIIHITLAGSSPVEQYKGFRNISSSIYQPITEILEKDGNKVIIIDLREITVDGIDYLLKKMVRDYNIDLKCTTLLIDNIERIVKSLSPKSSDGYEDKKKICMELIELVRTNNLLCVVTNKRDAPYQGSLFNAYFDNVISIVDNDLYVVKSRTSGYLGKIEGSHDKEIQKLKQENERLKQERNEMDVKLQKIEKKLNKIIKLL
jgi:hypothetical protein